MVRKKTDEISRARTLKSNRGNILQGKPSWGFSIQIKLRSYSLNTASSWQLEAFPSICALVSFQSQAEPDCHTEQVLADTTCTSSGGSRFSSFQTFQIELCFFSVIVFSNLRYPVICTTHLHTLTQHHNFHLIINIFSWLLCSQKRISTEGKQALAHERKKVSLKKN